MVEDIMNLNNVEYRNPIHTGIAECINCEINHPVFGWIPFTASILDVEQHGRDIYNRILSDGNIAEYIPPPDPTTEELSAEQRFNRDQLLKETDWTQLPDVPQSTKTKWAEYRQLLRDVPQQNGFPYDIIWPEKP